MLGKEKYILLVTVSTVAERSPGGVTLRSARSNFD